MPHTVPTTPIAQLLATPRVIAVVGLSPRPERPSHEVAAYMQRAGWTVVPINPAAVGQTILGERVWADLPSAAHARAAAQLPPIAVVNCFRASAEIAPIAHAAVQIRAQCLWMQLGVENAQAAEIAQNAGLFVVQNRCIKIDHRNLIGQIG